MARRARDRHVAVGQYIAVQISPRFQRHSFNHALHLHVSEMERSKYVQVCVVRSGCVMERAARLNQSTGRRPVAVAA